MPCSNTHSHTGHVHGPNCGHTAIKHDNHTDYLVDGILHHPHGDHCDDHVIELSDTNADSCNPVNTCNGHTHGPDCGHEAIKHGDHMDYIVDGRLHHQHGDHCDDHGPVDLA